MITEKQFLEALEIVKAYQKQINEQVESILPKNNKLKKDDKIRITKTSGLSNLIKEGQIYRVVSFTLHPTKSYKFFQDLRDKYGDRDLTHAEIENEIEKVHHYATIKIDLGDKHYREFRTTAGYEYEKI